MSSLETISNFVLDKNESHNKNTTDSRINKENSRISSIYERCQICSKKAMTYNKCKCSNFYCGKHIHQHECSFSHFSNHKSLLEKKQIKVESDKIIKL